MGVYASGISRPVHRAVRFRLAPAIRRISSTASGSSQQPTTASVPMAAMSSTVTKRYMPKHMAAATTRCTVAIAARCTAFHMRLTLEDRSRDARCSQLHHRGPDAAHSRRSSAPSGPYAAHSRRSSAPSGLYAAHSRRSSAPSPWSRTQFRWAFDPSRPGESLRTAPPSICSRLVIT
ncbi:hypothetical protein M2156_004444 [Streptomyces sp. SAI-149]|nr:hypothetical protein [Streptomyces sp. SAI-149]